jgi:hypothetical protein
MIGSTPVQTTYSKYQRAGQVGMPASTTSWDADTYIADDPAGAGIGFGLAVSRGTASERACTLGQLSGGDFIGITMADNTLANLSASFTDKYADTENVGVLVRGDIFVVPATNVTAGGSVYYNSSTGQLGDSGISNAVQITNARWMSSYPATDPGGEPSQIAIVRLGYPA